jgi:U3 small nucleolar RNA-associated protein 21
MAAAVAPAAAAAAAAGEPSPAAGSPLFRPFRALGYITDDVPFAVQRRGKEAYVTVSVGRTWQVYSAAKLTLVMVGPPLARPVRALAVKGDLTFAATGSAIEECRRMHKCEALCLDGVVGLGCCWCWSCWQTLNHPLSTHRHKHTPHTHYTQTQNQRVGEYRGHTGAITALLVIGDRLLSIGADRRLLVWAIGRYDGPEAALEFGATFEPTCLAHPDTYLNKVVVGAADGRLALWNFATGARLHEFAGWCARARL